MSEIEGTEVGSAVVEAITGQGDLLTTLSLAIIGGLFAFAVQIVLHNEGNELKRISLNAIWALMLCAALQLGSIVAGYMLRGTLVAAIPMIFGSKFAVDSQLQDNQIIGLDKARELAVYQFSFFAVGILMMIVFLLLNYKKLRG